MPKPTVADARIPAQDMPPQRLNDVVYDAIVKAITEGEWEQGHKLPPEHILAEQFNVSRPVVRQALARLRDDGLVASRQGSGSFVRQRPSGAVLGIARLSSIADMQRCFEFRVSIEGEAAWWAARQRTDEALADIERALASLDTAVEDNALGVEADIQLHMTIARATGNRFFVEVLASLHDSIATGINLTRNLTLLRPRDRTLQVQQEHRDIVQAIRDQDSARAREAARRHLENARRRVFEGDQIL